MSLTQKKCVSCEGGAKALTVTQEDEFFRMLKLDWKAMNRKKIKHEFQFRHFKDAMYFVHKVADLAEREGHHPDIHIHYNRVLIELWTHAVGGLSENDFILAAKIEAL